MRKINPEKAQPVAVRDETRAGVEYVAAKHLDEAVFDAAAGMGDRGGLSHVAGMDEAVRHDESGRVFVMRWSVEEYTAQDALRDLAAEVRRGAEDDEDAQEAAVWLRRAGYEGCLRVPRNHLAYVELALEALDAMDTSEGQEAAAESVARPYLLRKREELRRVIAAIEAER